MKNSMVQNMQKKLHTILELTAHAVYSNLANKGTCFKREPTKTCSYEGGFTNISDNICICGSRIHRPSTVSISCTENHLTIMKQNEGMTITKILSQFKCLIFKGQSLIAPLPREPRHEKTCLRVSDQVRHKPGCTNTEED